MKKTKRTIYGNDYDKRAEELRVDTAEIITKLFRESSRYAALKKSISYLEGFGSIEEKAKAQLEEKRTALIELMEETDAKLGLYNRYTEDNFENMGHPEYNPTILEDSISLFAASVSGIAGEPDE